MSIFLFVFSRSTSKSFIDSLASISNEFQFLSEDFLILSFRIAYSSLEAEYSSSNMFRSKNLESIFFLAVLFSSIKEFKEPCEANPV